MGAGGILLVGQRCIKAKEVVDDFALWSKVSVLLTSFRL
jgi:hypothetical protein